jgi:hypothetical protein
MKLQIKENHLLTLRINVEETTPLPKVCNLFQLHLISYNLSKAQNHLVLGTTIATIVGGEVLDIGLQPIQQTLVCKCSSIPFSTSHLQEQESFMKCSPRMGRIPFLKI